MSIRDLFFKSEPVSEPVAAFPRCEHRSPAGRQCSQPICSTSPRFCFTHKPKPEELTIAELTEAAGSLSTPEEIHRFLTHVTLLRVQGRLTPKEACAYAYLCQILQRGQREIAFHQKLRDDRAEHQAQQSRSNSYLSWRLPRPDYSDPSDSPPSGEDAEWSIPRPGDPAPGESSSHTTNTSVKLSPPTQSMETPSDATDTLVEVFPSSLALSASEGSATKSSSPSSSTDTLVEVLPPSSPVSSESSSRATDTSVEVSPSHLPVSASSAATSTLVGNFPPRRSLSEGGASASRSDTANSKVELPPLAQPASGKKSSPSKSTAKSSAPASLPVPPDFYNHFYPFDPSLPPGLQDPRKNIPPPDEAECRARERRRGLLFNRRRPNLRGTLR